MQIPEFQTTWENFESGIGQRNISSERALSTFIQFFSPEIKGYILKECEKSHLPKDEHFANSLVDDAFVVLIKMVTRNDKEALRFDSPEPLRSLLYTIVKNLFKNFRRKNERHYNNKSIDEHEYILNSINQSDSNVHAEDSINSHVYDLVTLLDTILKGFANVSAFCYNLIKTRFSPTKNLTYAELNALPPYNELNVDALRRRGLNCETELKDYALQVIRKNL